MNSTGDVKARVNTLIMGIGNLLLGDEGVGVHAAQALLEDQLPENVQVIDVGTAFLDALPDLEKAQHIIVIDAVNANDEPGSVYRMELGECNQPERIDSMHGFDLFRMLAVAQNNLPAEITVLGVEPACMNWSTQLSPQVLEAMPVLLDAVYKEIGVDNTCQY